MGWLDFLTGGDATPAAGDDSETIRKIAGELDALPPDRARLLAAFAYVLGRVAYADRQVTEAETRAMERVVQEIGGLPAGQAALAVQIAKSQNRLFGGTENFRVTKEFQALASDEERHLLLDSLFAVSAADDTISGTEEAQIRQIASELGFSHGEFVEARSRWSDKRSVIQALAQRDTARS